MRSVDMGVMNGMMIRVNEQESIHEFVAEHADLFTGSVLDYGCGRVGTCRTPEPYRGIVEAAGGKYESWDPEDGSFIKFLFHRLLPLGILEYDTVLCTQAVHYDFRPQDAIVRWPVKKGGHIVMTYPTAWPELHEESMEEVYRVTGVGMRRIVESAGYRILSNEPRVKLMIPGFELVTGYGMVAVKE